MFFLFLFVLFYLFFFVLHKKRAQFKFFSKKKKKIIFYIIFFFFYKKITCASNNSNFYIMSSVYAFILRFKMLYIKQSYRTLAEREFGWGGTSVIMKHRCPKDSSVRTETSP
jgi:hypothetical protein